MGHVARPGPHSRDEHRFEESHQLGWSEFQDRRHDRRIIVSMSESVAGHRGNRESDDLVSDDGVCLEHRPQQLSQPCERAHARRRSNPFAVKRPPARRPSDSRIHVGDFGKVRRCRVFEEGQELIDRRAALKLPQVPPDRRECLTDLDRFPSRRSVIDERNREPNEGLALVGVETQHVGDVLEDRCRGARRDAKLGELVPATADA